jgi:O-Antigen ligase
VRPEARRPPRNAELPLALALVLALGVVAFTTAGGEVNLAANTWTEIAVVAIACALALAVSLRGAAGPAWGAPSVALFAAVAALTAVSIAWSVAPGTSWIEAGRTASYLAAFGAAAALGRLLPDRWRSLVIAIAALALALSAWAVLVKVFPSSASQQRLLGRLLEPFGYWNATGLMAAMGVAPVLWLGTRPGASRTARTLAVPAVALLVAVLALTYSRSAVLAGVLAVAVYLAAVPGRLRAVLVLTLGGAGGAATTLWALSRHALTHDNIVDDTTYPFAQRVSAGHAFGIVVAVVLAAMVAAGFAATVIAERRGLSDAGRRRVGTALVALLGLVPVGAVAALASSSRGLSGEISHLWDDLTTTTGAGVGDQPGRLVAVANSRPRYWHEGLTVGEHALLEGVGAGGFAIAQAQYGDDTLVAGNAHSYVIETFADFGLIGLALNLGLLVAWLRAAARTLGGWRGPPAGPAGEAVADERAGMWTLLATVVAFGVSSAIDWTWFYPGVALPALICAGWLAGRGPLPSPIGTRPAGGRGPGLGPAATVALTGAVVLALLICWAIWQPLRSADAQAAAGVALGRGQLGVAIADARAAANELPVSADPVLELAAIYEGAGDLRRARTELLEATRREGADYETWYQLGAFELGHGHPRQAAAALARAHRLDLADQPTLTLLARARAAASKRP